jgi:acetyltransferase
MGVYPRELEREIVLNDGSRVTIRPISPADAQLEQEFVQGLSPQSRYFRFLDSVPRLSPRMLQHFTDIDYDQHMALIAVDEGGARPVQVGVVRYVVAPDGEDCEFALTIADAWQRRGLGAVLLRLLIEVARGRGLRSMHGDVLATNAAMLAFAAKLGFSNAPSADDPATRKIRLEIAPSV